MTAEPRYNVWTRVPGLTRWLLIDGNSALPQSAAVARQDEGNVNAAKSGTDIEYLALPVDMRPSSAPQPAAARAS